MPPDWKTPLAALAAAVAPNSDVDALMTAFPTPILLTSYDAYAHTLTGAIGENPMAFAQQITVTTAPSPTPSYVAGPGPNVIHVTGLDFQGNYCADDLVLTQPSGGETVATQALFSQVTQILIHPQADANGSFQFGIVNAPSLLEIASAQSLMATLQAAGAAYASQVQSNFILTPPSRVPAGTGPQVFTGRDANGVSVSAYREIPIPPTTGPVSANDLYKACRYVAFAVGWPTDEITHVLYLPPFNIDTPADPNDVMGQLNGTWPIVSAFLAAQPQTLPPVVTAFLTSTLLPMLAAAKAWAQYLRDFPSVTWPASAPPPTSPPPAESLVTIDPALVAVQSAIAGANAFLVYVQTP